MGSGLAAASWCHGRAPLPLLLLCFVAFAKASSGLSVFAENELCAVRLPDAEVYLDRGFRQLLLFRDASLITVIQSPDAPEALLAPQALGVGALLIFTGRSQLPKSNWEAFWEAGSKASGELDTLLQRHSAPATLVSEVSDGVSVVDNQQWLDHEPTTNVVKAAVDTILANSLQEACPCTWHLAMIFKLEGMLALYLQELHEGVGDVDLGQLEELRILFASSAAAIEALQQQAPLQALLLIGQRRVAAMLDRAAAVLGVPGERNSSATLTMELQLAWLGLDGRATAGSSWQDYNEPASLMRAPPELLSPSMRCLQRTAAMKQLESSIPGPPRLFWHHMADVYQALFDWRLADLGTGEKRALLWRGTALLEKSLDFVWQHCSPAAGVVMLLRAERWMSRMTVLFAWGNTEDMAGEAMRQNADRQTLFYYKTVQPLLLTNPAVDSAPQAWQRLLLTAQSRLNSRVLMHTNFSKIPYPPETALQHQAAAACLVHLQRFVCHSSVGPGVSHLLSGRAEQASVLVRHGKTKRVKELSLPRPARLRKKLAFLFMIYDQLNFLQLWQRFFATASAREHKILVHAAREVNTTQLDYLAPFLVQPQPSSWSNMSLVFYALFEAVLKDPDVEKAVLLSQDTVPLATFDQVHRWALADRGMSWLCLDLEFTRAEPWLLLTRKHLELLVRYKSTVFDMNNGIGCCDAEDMVPQALYLLQEHRYLRNRCIVFTQWALPKYFAVGRTSVLGLPPPLVGNYKTTVGSCGHPNWLEEPTATDVLKLINDVRPSRHWFARKFRVGTNISFGDGRKGSLEDFLLETLFGAADQVNPR